jgi:predicted dehydrogenase
MHFENGIAQISGQLDQPFNLRFLMRDEPLPEDHYYEGSDGVREEIKHFIDCVREDKEPMSTGRDGKKALEIALAVIESIQKHSIVKLASY